MGSTSADEEESYTDGGNLVNKRGSLRDYKYKMNAASPLLDNIDSPKGGGYLEDLESHSGGNPPRTDPFLNNPGTLGTSEVSSLGTDDPDSLTPHIKALPSTKLNANKLFDKVTFCLKLIKNEENYDDLKDTITQHGGSITDVLTNETDMLLIEYDIKLPEVIEGLTNYSNVSNINDQSIIADAISRNITVATDIYVWQCILNSDLVPIDDFELVRGVEGGLSATAEKKIVSNLAQSRRPSHSHSENLRPGSSSPVKSHQQKTHADKLTFQAHFSTPSQHAGHILSHHHLRRANGPVAHFHRRLSGIYDISSECNSSDDELQHPNLNQNIQYHSEPCRNIAKKNSFAGFETVTSSNTQDVLSEHSVRVMSGYYRWMHSHSRTYGGCWIPDLESPGSLNSQDRSNSSGHNVHVMANSLHQRSPSHYRNHVFSNEIDNTFQNKSFSSIERSTPSRPVNAKMDDFYDNSSLDFPIVYHSSDYSSTPEGLNDISYTTNNNNRSNQTRDSMFAARNTVNIKSESQMERLGWSAMLKCILASDFIRTEGRRLLNYDNTEPSKPDPGDQIWIEIRANLHGLSVEEELKMTESQRVRMGLVLEEICRVSFADTPSLTVYDQVTDLLERVSHFKSLYPSLKVLKKKKPSFYNPQLQRRLDALTSWVNIKNSIVHHLYLLNTWAQCKHWPAKRMQEFLNVNKRTELASVEMFLGEMPSIRMLEYRIINTLRKALLKVKSAISDNAKTFHRMKLPFDNKGIERLACFCSDMVVETLKVQVQLAEPFSKHGDNILEQVIENFSDDLSLSIKVKELSMEIDQPSEGWVIESSLNPIFGSTILRFLKCYFSLIKQRLMEASEQVFFKEAELVESKWTSVMRVRDMIECTDVEIAIQFCRLASELINRLFVYIKHHTYQSVSNNYTLLNTLPQQDFSQGSTHVDRLVKHYGRIVDNVKSRARKLLGFFRMLGMEFENCSEYTITGPIRAFLDRLAESRHVLVHTNLQYTKNVFICASAPLLKTPHKIINILKNCPRRSNLSFNDTYSYVLIMSFKKCPSFGFKWKGWVVQVNVLKALRSIDLKKDVIRLVAENTNSLSNCRQRFEAVAVDLVKSIRVQKAHIESVNRELKKIRDSTLKLSLAVCPLAEKIASSLTLVPTEDYSSKQTIQDSLQVQQARTGQNFEIIQETYIFASGFALRSMKRLHKGKKWRYLQSQLLNLSLKWIEFCTNTNESDLPPLIRQEAYNCHITALRFLINLANDKSIMLLSKGDFARLKKSVSDCLSKVLKMCRNVAELDNCEKIRLNYGFNKPSDNALNCIGGAIEKNITEIGLKNPMIGSLAMPEIRDTFHGTTSPSYDPINAISSVQVGGFLNRSKNRDIITDTSIASDNPDATQDLSTWDPMPNENYTLCESEVDPSPILIFSEVHEPSQHQSTHQRIDTLDKITDVFSMETQTSKYAGADPDFELCPAGDPNTEVLPFIGNQPLQELSPQLNKPGTPTNMISQNAHAWQDQSKCAQQHYFGQVNRFKAVGRRFFSGVENLYMLQKKNRWRQRINELEEKISSKQRSKRIIGKMLDNTSYEDRNISLIARNSGSISIRWRQGLYLGSGSFGDVYIGTNLETGDTMAVKEIKFFDARNLEKLAKFIIEEMNVLQMLHHPSIIDYYGIEVYRDRIYIFMECCKYSLARVLETVRFDDENILKIYTKHLLKGLAYLHGNGIIHRDIKPANILFSKEGRIKYVDFGASKIFRTEDNLIGYNGDTRTLVGTPQYIAPEVINNEINHKRGSRDVWALGCCILQMFTGKNPWGDTDNDWAIMWRIGTSNDHPEIPPPPVISEQAASFLKKCFTRPARERPTAEDLMNHEWTAEVEGECPDISYIEKLLAESPKFRDNDEVGSSVHRGL